MYLSGIITFSDGYLSDVGCMERHVIELPSKGHPYSMEAREAILNALEKEKGNIREIAKSYGVHPVTVWRWVKLLQRNGHYEPGKKGFVSKYSDEFLINYVAQNHLFTYREMSQELGLSPERISSRLNQLGIRKSRRSSCNHNITHSSTPVI